MPDDQQAAAQEARASLMESAAEGSEELMNKYFEEGELSPEDLVQGLRLGIAQGVRKISHDRDTPLDAVEHDTGIRPGCA